MKSIKVHFTHLFLFLVTLFISACDPHKNIPDNNEILSKPAKLQEVGLSQKNDFLSYPAVIAAQNTSSLSFEVSGVIKELLVIEAQRVNKGDILAKLDSRDLLSKLESAQAQYDSSNSDFERAVRLMKEDAISRSELEQRRTKQNVNKAKLETAKKALQDSTLIAPFSGAIAEISITSQQAISSGKTVMTLIGGNKMEASINLPASILATALKKDNQKDTSYLVFSFSPEQRIPAQFTEVTLAADSASQTYKVTFSFSSPKNLNILPGMNATIWFEDPSNMRRTSTEISVPLTAISSDGEQKYVWVVNRETMLVSKRNITIADDIGESLQVTSGLTLGETIVVAGVSSLSAGMKVHAWSK